MKKRANKTAPATATVNSTVEAIEISHGPGGTNPASVIIRVAFVPGVLEVNRLYRSLATHIETGDPVATIGKGLIRISWLLDICWNIFSAHGQIVRIKVEDNRLTDIGHALLDRWLIRDMYEAPKYPFYIPKQYL